jgi:hypothetical protein
VKWLALGVSGAAAGLVYLTAPRWWGKLPALPGFAALALVALGLQKRCADFIDNSIACILLFWLLVVLHAVGASTVAVRPLEERSAR